MDTLEKQVSGDWIDIRESSKELYSLFDFFKVPHDLLESEMRNLSNFIELGIVEYKNHIINSLFRTLGNIKYRSLSLEAIGELEEMVLVLLFITLVQRLIASGSVKLEDEHPSGGISPQDIEINLILKDVLARVKADPECAKKTEIKNILVQLTIYKNERETLKKFSPQMKDKNSTMYQNFKATFEKIFASIRKNYAIVLEEEAGKRVKRNILKSVQGKSLGTILFNQCREFSRILTTLRFVQEEKYKIREVLLQLNSRQAEISGLVAKELELYKTHASGDERAREKIIGQICLQFVKEINALITRKIS